MNYIKKSIVNAEIRLVVLEETISIRLKRLDSIFKKPQLDLKEICIMKIDGDYICFKLFKEFLAPITLSDDYNTIQFIAFDEDANRLNDLLSKSSFELVDKSKCPDIEEEFTGKIFKKEISYEKEIS